MEYIQTEPTEWGVNVRVTVSDDRTEVFSGFDKQHVQMRGIMFYSLYQRCEDGCPRNKDEIPASVEALGNAGIAAYMFAVQEEGYEGAAGELDVSVDTVRQYLSDFKQGRR